MRKLLPILSILTMVILLAGCQKDRESNQEEEGEGSLVGTWELHKTWGGMSPLTFYPAGNGFELVIDSTTYKRMSNGNIVDEGTYQLINDAYTDVNSCEQIPARDNRPNHIIFKSSSPLKNYYEVSSKTLLITTSCVAVDGGGAVYKRKSTLATDK
jgi:hypothetical protein